MAYKNDGYGETYIMVPPTSGSTVDIEVSCSFDGQCLAIVLMGLSNAHDNNPAANEDHDEGTNGTENS